MQKASLLGFFRIQSNSKGQHESDENQNEDGNYKGHNRHKYVSSFLWMTVILYDIHEDAYDSSPRSYTDNPKNDSSTSRFFCSSTGRVSVSKPGDGFGNLFQPGASKRKANEASCCPKKMARNEDDTSFYGLGKQALFTPFTGQAAPQMNPALGTDDAYLILELIL